MTAAGDRWSEDEFAVMALEASALLQGGEAETKVCEHSSEDEGDKRKQRDRKLEELLYSAGFGVFHVILILVTGLATAADAVEIFGVSFVIPIADRDLDLSTAHKGYLDASIFLGEGNE